MKVKTRTFHHPDEILLLFYYEKTVNFMLNERERGLTTNKNQQKKTYLC